MKYKIRMLVLALALGGWGLMATGCDQIEEILEDLTGSDEEVADDDDDVAEVDEADEREDEEEQYDQAMYILAAFEVECVDQEIEDEDEAAEIKEEIYARYGFDQSQFEAAATAFEGEEAVRMAIDASMDSCNEELAQGLRDAGADQIALADLDVEVDQTQFINAAFEVECIEQEIDDSDEAAAAKEAVFERYGLSEASYAEVQQALEGSEAVRAGIGIAMERCDEEVAQGLVVAATLGDVSPEDAGRYVVASFVRGCLTGEMEDQEAAWKAVDELWEPLGYHQAESGGFEGSYGEADGEMEDLEAVEAAVEEAMESCDEEVAQGLAAGGTELLEEVGIETAAFGTAEFTAGLEELAQAGRAKFAELQEEEEVAEEDDEPEAAAQPAQPAQPARTGRMTASITGNDFENTSLELQVRPDFQVTGRIRGQREGRGFQVPFTGEVSQDGVIRANGQQGQDSIRVEGRLSSSGARGTVSGDVHQRSYDARYSAN